MVAKSWLEAEKKISSGVFKKTLSENPTTEELVAYWKEAGVEGPAKYPLETPKEVTVSEADKPILDVVKKVAYESGIDPKAVQKLTNAVFAARELELQDFNESVIKTVDERRTELRTAMGADFDKNVAMGNAFIAEIIGERGPQLASLKLVDGTDLGSHPDFVRFVAQAARTYGSDIMQIPESGGPQGGEARIAELQKMMGDTQSDYWKGPKAESIQAEYRTLIERRDRVKSRAA